MIDLEKSCVSVDGSFTAMTSSEYRLLCFLARSSGQILTRERLLEYMWDSAENFVDDNTLSVYIRRLRAKSKRIRRTLRALSRCAVSDIS